jgi:hypothetical protein
MAAFQDRPLVRDFHDSRKLHVAEPAVLKLSVKAARQLFPSLTTAGNTVLLLSGLIRFGQDGNEPGEDPRNENNAYAEVDGVDNNSPRTVLLQLRGPALTDAQFAAASGFGALADVYLTTTDTFGAATNASGVQLTAPTENGNQLDRDLWFLSDVSAERTTGDTSLINRMAFEATVLLTLP